MVIAQGQPSTHIIAARQAQTQIAICQNGLVCCGHVTLPFWLV
jgi:hypothetical protein